MMMLFLIGPPLVAASVAIAVRPYRTWVGWVNVIAAGLSLAVSLAAALASAEVLRKTRRETSQAMTYLTCIGALARHTPTTLAATLGVVPTATRDVV